VDAVRREIDVDPLFRRRLRGAVMNQYVAHREGAVVGALPPKRSEMGRLGRACLYASLATALSVGGVMAASESAVPGDFLYPLKRSIEEMRIEVAPAQLRGELAAYGLAERVDELASLIESGDTDGVAALAQEIRETYDQLLAAAEGAALDDRLAAQLDRLDATLEHAPVRARRAVERAMSGAPGLQTNAFDAVGPSEGSRDPGPQRQGGGLLNGGGANEPPGPVDRTPPEEEPKPEPTPSPMRSHGPSPSPELP
jgi:hypothetical protein